MKKKKISIAISWSIHQCKRTIIDGDCGESEIAYMTVVKNGRSKEQKLHKTLGKALNHVGI